MKNKTQRVYMDRETECNPQDTQMTWISLSLNVLLKKKDRI